MRKIFTRNFWSLTVAVVAAAGVVVGSMQSASAQVRIKALAPAGVVPAVPAVKVAPGKGDKKAKDADDAADEMQQKAEKEFPGGAALKTDPEQQRLLKRAEQCVADGRLDLAAVLWQKVLDEAGDTLMTRDGRTYTSLAEEVERMLSSADPLALKTYRIAADGEAQAVLAKAAPDREEEALSIVVRRYFLSSSGDEAAFKLGCYALDRHDFVGASRLFAKILERHPDPTVPRGEIMLRLAVAAAHVGDIPTAKAALEAIPQMPGPKPTNDSIDLVEQDATEAAKTAALVSVASQNWHMMLGNPSRSGRMKELPSDVTTKTLSELWTQEFSLLLENAMNQNGMMSPMVMVRSGRVRQNAQTQPVSREQLISQWKQNKWNPTSQLLFDNGKVYIKTNEDIACFSASGNTEKPVWRSVWLNQYDMDSMTSQLIMMANAYGMQMPTTSRPRTLPEVIMFGDRIHQAMSISNGTIYSIEGKRVSKETGPTGGPAVPRPFQWNVQPRRSRSNFLAAYEASNGKAKWHRSASDEDKEGSQDVGFMSAPVPYGNLLLVPITDGGTIWLYGLDSKDGSTVWKAYLCDEPASGANPWSAVGISVDGRDAYILPGTGVVFAIDAVSGAIRWAVRYKRNEKDNVTTRNFNGMISKDVEGWDDDVVIPYGKDLIVLASDSNEMMWLDRRTGGTTNNGNKRTPSGSSSNYVLGTKGRKLFVAGRNVIRCFDLINSKLIWEKDLEDSLGRGVLTEDAIYIPVKNSVMKLDLEKGRDQGQVGVQLTTEDPVGNLFSDGEKLWVAGAGRVYAMTNLDHRMAILAEKIAAGDGEAQLNRMRLYLKEKKFEETLADLKGAYQLFKASLTPDQAADKFFAALAELRLAQENPALVLELLAEEYVKSPSIPQLGKEMVARRNDLLSSSLSVIRLKKKKGLTSQVLGIASLLEPEYLQHAAAQSLDITLRGEEDLPPLQEAVAGGNVTAQLISVGALAKADPKGTKETLTKLLEAKDDRLKLAAARALTNAGERSTLAVFVKLMESENSRVRVRAHQSLRSLSSQQIVFSSEGKPEERAKAIDAWKAWLEKDGMAAKLTLPLSETDVPLGRMLITSHVHSLIIELDANHKERWRMQVASGNPWGCQGLPNGNRLIAITSQAAVVEYNEEGKEVWKKDRLPSTPYGVQRLSNGNTLIACADTNQVLEVAPDGSTSTFAQAGRPMCAQRLENGNTLIALQTTHRVVEVDKDNKVVWEARNMNGPCSATRLENGNTLVVQMYAGQVVELDATGKSTVWSAQVPLVSPCSAQRLPNGNTLIADNNGVVEVDPSGKEIRWKHVQNNTSCVSQF